MAADSLPMAYLATSGHWFFAALQVMAAASREAQPRAFAGVSTV